MLCDDIIERGADGNQCDTRTMIPRIRDATKFVLAPEFASVAEALSLDYGGLTRAFPFCRMPYPKMWIEVAHLDRPRFSASPIQAPEFQVIPRRIGYLLEATRDDLSAWKAHLFWSTAAKSTNACAALAMLFDMTEVLDTSGYTPSTNELDDEIKRSRVLRHVPSHPGWLSANVDVRRTILAHTKLALTDYPLPMPRLLPHEYDEFYKTVFELARSDWAGEPAFLLAVIGLLNARNVVATQDVDNTSYNRKRAKNGQRPLLSHKVLRIHHRQQKRAYGHAKGSGGDYEPMRMHMVRGHWKVRKSGIFFWHPFVRGDAKTGRVTKDYEVQS